jgi:hypothetical protein
MSYKECRYWVKYSKGGKTWWHAGMTFEQYHSLVAGLAYEHIAYEGGEE